MISDELGIVAIGRNEGKRLINCLNSIRAEAKVPTVYVDSGSTDRSSEAAAGLGVTVVNLDMARPFTAARARNEGYAALLKLQPNTRFVQFIDGDCELVSGWLGTALEFFAQRSNVAVVCGRRRERHPETSIYNRLCDVEWDTPIGEATACGGDAMIRADALQAARGYRNELIAGEEPEFCLRLRKLGWKIWRLDAEMTRHDAAMTRFAQWWRRTVRSGYAYAEIAQLHKNSKLRIYAQEVRRAIAWGGLLPLVICMGLLVHPAAGLGTFIYPLQVCRIAMRKSGDRSTAWTYASFLVIAKFAELQGVLKFQLRRLSGQAISLIEYK
jgi:GT2 family glycosyltransferase